jgi:hypothetical protein
MGFTVQLPFHGSVQVVVEVRAASLLALGM